MNLMGRVHGRLVHQRRVARLADCMAPALRPGWSVIDIGCGDGLLGALLQQRVPGLHVQGYDVLVRPTCHVPCQLYDGSHLPAADNAVDAALLVDVLHHTDDPLVLLREAARVARRVVIVKDHRLSRPLARPLLRCMDWVGNGPHGVEIPCNYWPEWRWLAAWRQLKWSQQAYHTQLGLYPWPASWLFERGLHFVAVLTPPVAQNPARVFASRAA